MGKNRAEKIQGAEGFEKYYSLLYGARWPQLKAALDLESGPVAFNAGKKDYFLDRASILCALTLPLENAFKILDMCAAPGGKSLVLSCRMDKDANLLANERSAARALRLRRVLDEHLNEDVRARVQLSCSDAAVMCRKESECYDSILLDAPCSSERHVLHDEKYLSQWSPARIKTLSIGQWALLSCGYRLLKNGGHLLYSTCAVNETENVEVIRRLLKKFSGAKAVSLSACAAFQKDAAEKIRPLLKGARLPAFEEKEYGACILPDREDGAGPIYFCLIQKCSKIEK